MKPIADGMPGRLAVCWFDVLLLAMVLVCASALWTGARRSVIWLRQHHQPEKLAFDRHEDGPLRRVELAAAEKEREAVHAAQIDAEMSIARMTAEIQAEAKNRPAAMDRTAEDQFLEAQRQRKIKLDTAFLMAKTLATDAEVTRRRVADARTSVADAARLAEMQFTDARQDFEMATRLITIGLGVAAWIVVLAGAEILLRSGGRWVTPPHRGFVIAGQSHRGFVMIPAVLLLAVYVGYELLK